MPFEFKRLDISGAVLIEPKVFRDPRGFFLEVFKESDFVRAGLPSTFVQENHSGSVRGVLRGLHYQRAPKAQGKMVRAVAGEVFDVIVDMRRDSPTCGRWVGVELSASNRRMLYVPPWCAHGFCVTSEEAEVVYSVTEEYSPADEGGVAWNDKKLDIPWPVSQPFLSERDQKWGAFESVEEEAFGTIATGAWRRR